MAYNKTFLGLLGFRTTGDLGPITLYTDQRGDVVFYPRIPAMEPPTWRQLNQRTRWIAAAAGWQGLLPSVKEEWELATKRLSLRLTGYNLWVYFRVTSDFDTIRQIERESGLALLPT
jgi:hypothetical protein